MGTDRAELHEAYRELLRDRNAALAWSDVPDPDLLRSLEETLRKVAHEVDVQRRAAPGLLASQVAFDRLVLENWSGPSPKPKAVGDNIIRHLALIPYPTWAHVGRESRSVLLHRMATMAQRPRAFSGIGADQYQRLLDEKQEQIERLIERAGRAVPRVYVGLFPTGSHNAEAMAVEGGTLVLVNSGLINLLYQVAKIHVASAVFNNDKPLIDRVQTSIALGELLMAHTIGGSSFLARALPPLDRGRLEIASALATQAEAFVIAHEYGHALAGHLDPARTRLAIETPAGSLTLYQQAQDDEYEADRMAIEIIGPALRMPDSPRSEAIALSAVLMCFFVDSAVWKFQRLFRRARPTPTTHPSTEERYERAIRQLAGLATSPIAFDHAQAIVMWFSAHEAHVVQLVSDALKLAAELGIESRDEH